MKKLLTILFMFMFLIGCGVQKLNTKDCSYCGGKIYCHLVERGFCQTQYQMNYEAEGGKYYHKWCAKIMKSK